MRHADYGDLLDPFVGVEGILDLLRADVLAAPNDQVLLSAGNDDIFRPVDPAQVPGAKVSVLRQGRMGTFGARVSDHHGRPPNEKLPLPTARYVRAIPIRYPQLVV